MRTATSRRTACPPPVLTEVLGMVPPPPPPDDAVVGAWASWVQPVSPHVRCEDAHAIFVRSRGLQILPVVDEHARPVGLLPRDALLELLVRRFGGEVLRRRQVAHVMRQRPLIVDADMSLDEVGRLVTADGGEHVLEGLVVVRDGCYAGIVTGQRLARALERRKQEQLDYLAHHDPLTTLPNRQLFLERLDRLLAAGADVREQVAVLFVDLDRFKEVNEIYGEEAGDCLLKEVATRMAASLRGGDMLARLGGDEFAVLLRDPNAGRAAALVAEKLLSACAESVSLGGEEIAVSCSVGIAIAPFDGATQRTLVRSADSALQEAKSVRNAWRRYSPDLDHGAPAICTSTALRRAIDEGELEVFYQPVLDASAAAVVGLEALVRWHHPSAGLVSAAEIVPLAEESGLISPMTERVAAEGMRQVSEWQRRLGLPALRLAVNVSVVQLSDGTLASMIDRLLDSTGFDPACLDLEITESTAMRAERETLRALRRLKDFGLRLAIDDFGTGYSSLSRLDRLPVDLLKIDKSFVGAIDRPDGRGGALAAAVLAMARSLNLQSIAEGVETPAQLVFLRAHGCEAVQGFLFAKPLPATEIDDFLAGRRHALAN